MPLEILGPLVVIGIAIGVVLVKLLVNQEPIPITDNTVAERLFLIDFPYAVPAGQVMIGEQEKYALLALSEPAGSVGLVHAMGSKWISRIITNDDLAEIGAGDEATLTIKLNDFTFNSAKVEFASKAEANRAKELLQSVMVSEKKNRKNK